MFHFFSGAAIQCPPGHPHSTLFPSRVHDSGSFLGATGFLRG